jgi:tetratricopeptide (TPR) repeat protein
MLGRWHLRRGEFEKAERHLRIAVTRLTERNPNPYDGEAHYNLGLTLRYRQRATEAYSVFYKSTWNTAWRGPAYHRLAEIDCTQGEWLRALDHLDRSLRAETDNLSARNLKVVALKRLGRVEELLPHMLPRKANVASLTGELSTLDHAEKLSGFAATLAIQAPHLTLLPTLEGHEKPKEAYRQALALMRQKDRPEGLYLSTANSMAVIQALQELAPWESSRYRNRSVPRTGGSHQIQQGHGDALSTTFHSGKARIREPPGLSRATRSRATNRTSCATHHTEVQSSAVHQ